MDWKHEGFNWNAQKPLSLNARELILENLSSECWLDTHTGEITEFILDYESYTSEWIPEAEVRNFWLGATSA